MVACFEVVEGAEETENDWADGRLAEIVCVDDFEEGEKLPDEDADGAGAHWLLEECDGQVPYGDEEGVAGAIDVGVAVDDHLFVGGVFIGYFDVEKRFAPVIEGVAQS